MKRPIPVVLLADDYALGILMGLVSWFQYRNYNLPFLPESLKGLFWLFTVLLSLLYGLLVLGLWNLREWARKIVVALKGIRLAGAALGCLGAGCAAIGVLATRSTAAYHGVGSLTWVSYVSLPFTIIAAWIPFFYLRQPEVRQIFRDTAVVGEPLGGSSDVVYGFNARWAAWIACSLGLIAFGQYQNAKINSLTHGGKNFDALFLTQMNKNQPKLQELEQRAAAANSQQRFYMLDDLAKAAYREGQFEKAKAYADELLNESTQYPKDWNCGNAIHHGHLILGRLALRESRLEEAKAQLLEAGKTPGSPQLDSFGPNMTLAKELLEKNERGVVLQYFALCRLFWKSGGSQLDEWTATVKQGGIPDFGTNLLY